MHKPIFGIVKGNAQYRAYLIPIFALATAVGVHAQWTVVPLHPGTRTSEGLGVNNGQQVGAAGGSPERQHASLWTGAAGSWVDLNPAGASQSHAYGVGDGQQVGRVLISGLGGFRASLWTGTAASWLNLHPAGAISSSARQARGGFQVGSVQGGTTGNHQAVLWHGTAESVVNLRPPGVSQSQAFDLWGNLQVGSVFIEHGTYGHRHASLWSGTAESWVDLNPHTEFAGGSAALGIYENQQVGYLGEQVAGSLFEHAGFWTGTAESWVSLHPDFEGTSRANGVYDGIQVGWVRSDSTRLHHASLWTGTAESWVDLDSFLPSQYSWSWANSVWHDGTNIYVVGSAFNGTELEAVMWTAPVPEPASMLAMGASLSALALRRRRKKL